jgi:bifunctional DNase/RNase
MKVISNEKTLRFSAKAFFWFALLIVLCGQIVAEDSPSIVKEQNELLQVKIHELIIDPTSMQPVVILADSLKERGLFIWIDHFAASAMNTEMKGIEHFRPLTHDLLERVIQKAKLKIQRVIITHVQEGIYYAVILIEDSGALIEIDSRPSDSIILALKFKAPILVSKSLFKDNALPLKTPKAIEEDYGLRFQELTPSLAQAFSFTSTGGALVSDIQKESRAEKDRIERGDVFVEVGGQPIADATSVRNALERSKVPVMAKIFRKGKFITVIIHPQ